MPAVEKLLREFLPLEEAVNELLAPQANWAPPGYKPTDRCGVREPLAREGCTINLGPASLDTMVELRVYRCFDLLVSPFRKMQIKFRITLVGNIRAF